VHQSGAEVGGDDAAERRHHQRAQVVQPDVEHDEEEVDHHQSDADAHADALLRPFTYNFNKIKRDGPETSPGRDNTFISELLI
jgi:hypothetical protein